MILIGKGVLGLPLGLKDQSNKTSFWRDRWLGDRPLMEQFSRLFLLDPDPDVKDSLHAFSFSEAPDRMVWDLAESGVFYVSSMRSCLDSFLLDRRIYRALVFFLPGFVSSLAQDRWLVGGGVTTPTEMTVKSLVTWADDIALDVGSKHVFDAVIMAAFWTIWSFRNKLLFGTRLISTDDLMGVIQTLNENATNEEVKEMMNEVDTNEEGTIDFHDFLNIMSKRVK
ncbi:RNA-directed DNA polymerase, eukaryota, reverse transcriptase zinc-binding domain protein, partial [Tanacetum coccineum]